MGFVLGLVDSLMVARHAGPSDPLEMLGCIAAGIAVYVLGGALIFAPLGFVLGRLGLGLRSLWSLSLGLALFAEIYWVSRPFVFPGYSSVSLERMAATLVMALLALALGWLLAAVPARIARSQSRVMLLLLSVLVLGGCGYLVLDGRRAHDARLGARNDRNADLPNVLLVVVDALRSDVLGAYGNTQVQTPVIDTLAENGVLFENCLAQAPFTWSSFGSILTGKYPRRHGLLKLKTGMRLKRDFNVTLPVHLKSARIAGQDGEEGELVFDDFATAAFMTGTMTNDSGLLQGFDLYCETLVGHETVYVASHWSAFRSDLLAFQIKNKLTQRLDYNKAVTTAIDWFEGEAERRRFAGMVHLYSTHTPYDPQEEFRGRYVDPNYDGPVDAFYAVHRIGIESGEIVPTVQDEQQIRDLYYGGTTQADHAIGLLLDELEERGVLDDTLVIVTSDHGEELGEHGKWEHNWMYQTNLRIPLIMSWPKGLPRGKRVGALVEMVDILPTICDLLGLELPAMPADPGWGDDLSPEELAAYYAIDGKSLMPLVRDEAPSLREFSFAENGVYLSIQDTDWKLIVTHDCVGLDPRDPEGWPTDHKAPRLFDLQNDPGEFNNLFGERPQEAQRLLTALHEWNSKLPIPLTDVVQSHRDAEHEENLSNLGYLEGFDQGEDEPEEDEDQ